MLIQKAPDNLVESVTKLQVLLKSRPPQVQEAVGQTDFLRDFYGVLNRENRWLRFIQDHGLFSQEFDGPRFQVRILRPLRAEDYHALYGYDVL